MKSSWCDVLAHARPIHYSEWTVACLSHQEIVDKNFHSHYFSIGIHPWWPTNLRAYEISNLKSAIELLSKDPRLVAIGETGLDRLYKETWNQQLELFHWHWDLAESLGLAMIIHKVRSGSDFLGLMKARRPKTPWVFHDYHGTEQEVCELLKLHPDCYFSFGDSLLNREKTSEVLEHIPEDRLLIETDEESQLELIHYFEKMAQIKGLSLADLELRIMMNFKKIFKIS